MSQTDQPIAAADLASSGVVLGQPRLWLGLEGAAVLFLATAVYAMEGHSWLLFAAVFLLPDISMLGYFLGPRFGAACYNTLHNYLLPVIVLAVCHVARLSPAIALIWIAHVGFDRMIGYGLKYDAGFSYTHLGRRAFNG